MFNRMLRVSGLCAAVFLICQTAAAAFPVQIVPGAYSGQWDVSGIFSAFTGAHTLNLAPGTYVLRVGRQNEGAFTFGVDETGNVSTQNNAAATAFGSTLTFKTAVINVVPGAYNSAPNFWDVRNVTSGQIGAQSVTLVTGVGYLLQIGRIIPGGFIIDVDAAGSVSSRNGAAASGLGSTLTLNTTTITIDAGTFNSVQNFFDLQGVTSGLTGNQNLIVVPGVSYFIRIGRINQGGFFIDVDGSGNVSSQNPIAATGDGSTLEFNTTPIFINPGAFNSAQNFFDLQGVTSGLTGNQNLTVVPGVSYFIRIGRINQGGFFVDVGASGDISSQNAASATGAGSTLTFNTTQVTLDPGDFDSPQNLWDFVNVTSGLAGVQYLILVPGVDYFVRIGRVNQGGFFARIDTTGNISSLNTGAAVGVGSTLTFNTTPITISPSSTTPWRINNVTGSMVGAASPLVVPGVSYFLAAPTLQMFTVAAPCAVDPSQLTIGATAFDISCGSFDSDSDGVPELVDNCPSDSNPDQVDQDGDGIGDLCDADIDGDGISNLLDNCAEFANPTQSDLDQDGAGDVCDGDDDSDSVSDLLDNCPVDSNTDQADNDNDQFGDLCDEDDDNDLISDVIDNCPVVANTDQSDFDGNGEGDACDGDIDNDGVANAADLCPLSPNSAPTNALGCTGAQQIAFTCSIENFAQHGQYVSCVAQAANDAVLEGLISTNEKARFVREAAKSK